MDAEGAKGQEGFFCFVAANEIDQLGGLCYKENLGKQGSKSDILRGKSKVVGIPVWNLRHTRNRLVNANGPTCTHGYWFRYLDSGASTGEMVVVQILA